MKRSDVLLCLIAVLAVGAALAIHTVQADDLNADLPDYHVVASGETYWSIAGKYWPGQHTGERVFALRQLNDNPPCQLRPGDRVYLQEEGVKACTK